jgi:hypothetical protein
MSRIHRAMIEYKVVGYRVKAVDQNVDGDLFLFYDNIYYKTETDEWSHELGSAFTYPTLEAAQAVIDRLCDLPLVLEKDVDEGYTNGVAYFMAAPPVLKQIFDVDGSDDFRVRFMIEPVLDIKPMYERNYQFTLKSCHSDGSPITKEEESGTS